MATSSSRDYSLEMLEHACNEAINILASYKTIKQRQQQQQTTVRDLTQAFETLQLSSDNQQKQSYRSKPSPSLGSNLEWYCFYAKAIRIPCCYSKDKRTFGIHSTTTTTTTIPNVNDDGFYRLNNARFFDANTESNEERLIGLSIGHSFNSSVALVTTIPYSIFMFLDANPVGHSFTGWTTKYSNRQVLDRYQANLSVTYLPYNNAAATSQPQLLPVFRLAITRSALGCVVDVLYISGQRLIDAIEAMDVHRARSL